MLLFLPRGLETPPLSCWKHFLIITLPVIAIATDAAQQALRAATERGVDRAKGMAEGERVPFFACGLSSVMHPKVCKPSVHVSSLEFKPNRISRNADWRCWGSVGCFSRLLGALMVLEHSGLE